VSETNKEDIAFNDFKGSVTVQEFNTVLRICEERYEKLAKVLSQREKFMEKAMEQLNNTSEAIEGSDMGNGKAEQAIGGLKKLLSALSKRGDKKMMKEIRKDILEAKHLTEFINRFKTSEEEKEHLDFSFLKDYFNE